MTKTINEHDTAHGMNDGKLRKPRLLKKPKEVCPIYSWPDSQQLANNLPSSDLNNHRTDIRAK
jgi:hypothetical protein